MKALVVIAVIVVSGAAIAETDFEKLWAACEKAQAEAVMDCVQAGLEKTRPSLPVTHPMESPEMEIMFRMICADFVHPETGQVAPDWCFGRQKLHRKSFLMWYRSKREAEVLQGLRDCLIESGGVATDDGLIDDSQVDWPAAVDCSEAQGL